MANKIRKWSRNAQEAAKIRGLVNLATKDVTGYSHNHISQCQLGKRWTSPVLALHLSAALGIPAHEFGQKRAKA